MRAVIQRVSRASVSVDGKECGAIGAGLLVFLGIGRDDDDKDSEWLINKIPQIRIFEDDEGKMNRSVREIDGEVMVISQFTLYGNLRKGSRPSFNRAALPDVAIPCYEAFVRDLSNALGKPVASGKFGEMMKIDACNDGPVTLILDTKEKRF